MVSLGPDEPRSCWNEALGSSVIVTGFPIPERHHGETGLEIPFEIMAGLGAVPLATQYAGGYILKGRSIVFVPVEREQDSVQWHLLHKNGGRIQYRDIANLCPHRLSATMLDKEGLLSTRAFLGWCPDSINVLGM